MSDKEAPASIDDLLDRAVRAINLGDRFTADALGDLAKRTGMAPAPTEAELLDAIDQARTERSFWRTFMIAALVMLVLESLLAERLHKHV